RALRPFKAFLMRYIMWGRGGRCAWISPDSRGRPSPAQRPAGGLDGETARDASTRRGNRSSGASDLDGETAREVSESQQRRERPGRRSAGGSRHAARCRRARAGRIAGGATPGSALLFVLAGATDLREAQEVEGETGL